MRPSAPASVRKVIANLFIAYRQPGADSDTQRAAIEMMASDVADIPVELLEKASETWRKSKRFLPRAAELIELARSFAPRPGGNEGGRSIDLAARHNARMDADPNSRKDIRWFTDESGNPYLDWVA